MALCSAVRVAGDRGVQQHKQVLGRQAVRRESEFAETELQVLLASVGYMLQ